MMERERMCAELDELLVPYLDSELPADEAGAIAAHLAICPECSRLAEEHRRAWKLLEELPEAPAAPSIWPRVVARTHRFELRARIFRRVAAAAAIVLAVTLVYFGYERASRVPLPDPDLLAHLPVVEQFASLSDAGGEGLDEDLDIVQAMVELTQESEDF